MPSQLKLLREARKTGNFDFVDRAISKRIKVNTSRIKGSRSPTDEDIERITEYYMDEEDLDKVYSKKSAINAVKNLSVSPKKGDTKQLNNFVLGVGESNFAKKVYEKYGKNRVEFVKSQKVIVKSRKKRAGYKVNTKSYLLVIKTKSGKEYIQARSFKNGRVIKMPKKILWE